MGNKGSSTVYVTRNDVVPNPLSESARGKDVREGGFASDLHSKAT
jgi:hypothetical protein